MKKLLLLLTAGLTAVSASAQVNNNMMLNPRSQSRYQSMPETRVRNYNPATRHGLRTSENKTTSSFHTDWWSFNDANNDGTFVSYNGTSNTGNLGAIYCYTDSNAYVPTATPPFYWWCHGLGTSFDPKSLYFSSLFAEPAPATPPFTLDTNQGYFIDSIFTYGVYNQVNASAIDTLYIELTYESDTNSYNVTWHGANMITYGITGGTDTTYGVAEPLYDAAHNCISATTPHRIRITKVLNTAAANDTSSTGWNEWSFPTGGLWVPKGKHVIAYAHFEPQTPCAFGTDLSTINAWIQASWDFNTPLQAANDWNSGLASTSDERHATSSKVTVSGNPILYPTYFFTAPASVHNPYFQFYLRQAIAVGVNDINSSISKVDAFPNPAKGMVNVSFNVAQNADVTVSLTNVVGAQVAQQTIANTTSGRASFDVSKFADGIYIYTVSANGQSSTGRIVVAH